MPWEIRVAPVLGIKRVEKGDWLGEIIAEALRSSRFVLLDDDVVVVTQKR